MSKENDRAQAYTVDEHSLMNYEKDDERNFKNHKQVITLDAHDAIVQRLKKENKSLRNAAESVCSWVNLEILADSHPLKKLHEVLTCLIKESK
jgi:hypothetical protein